MGIKKLVNKGTCFDCGVSLLVPSWKWCELHDPQRRKNKQVKPKPLPKVATYRFSDVTKAFKIHSSLNVYTIQSKDILVYDENNVIIGYK